jgi:hypothetical protein
MRDRHPLPDDGPAVLLAIFPGQHSERQHAGTRTTFRRAVIH